jgi:hypothetical protein
MTTFASKEIHGQFPPFEGWNIESPHADTWGNLIFRVTRRDRGQLQSAIVAVSYDQKPSERCIAGLVSAQSENRKRISRYMLVPQTSDVSCVPEGIRILTMKAFGFSDGELVWLTKKKHAERFHPDLAASV